MGFAEVVPRLPRILRRQREIVAAIGRDRPDVLVTVDSSSFNKRLVRCLPPGGVPIPRLHYVAPMVWAWRPGRVHEMARLFDHLLALFPFEAALFEAAGLATTYVGHPALEAPPGDGEAFRARHGVPGGDPILCLLPGSRRSEGRTAAAGVSARDRSPPPQRS